MGCLCTAQLQSLLGQFRNLPLSLLAAAFPTPISISHMANISAKLGAQATASAQLSAMAKLAASANLSASLSASAVARLEALAAIKMHLGVNPIKVGAAARLSLAIHSANLYLPSFQQALSQLLAPILNQLNEIAAALGAMLSVRSQLGINLMASASANLQAAFSARMSALASLQASASASVNLAATARLDLHARLVAAANILGINLGLPGAFASLNAALTASASLQLPQLNLGMGQMGSLASMLALLALIAAALGINLSGANTPGLLLSAKATIRAAIKAMAKLNLSAKASANLSARAQAQLTAKANVSASAKAAAGINFSGLSLAMPPFFASLNMLANLTAHLSVKNPAMLLSPCSVCAFAKL